jgi:hypothetical protein
LRALPAGSKARPTRLDAVPARACARERRTCPCTGRERGGAGSQRRPGGWRGRGPAGRRAYDLPDAVDDGDGADVALVHERHRLYGGHVGRDRHDLRWCGDVVMCCGVMCTPVMCVVCQGFWSGSQGTSAVKRSLRGEGRSGERRAIRPGRRRAREPEKDVCFRAPAGFAGKARLLGAPPELGAGALGDGPQLAAVGGQEPDCGGGVAGWGPTRGRCCHMQTRARARARVHTHTHTHTHTRARTHTHTHTYVGLADDAGFPLNPRPQTAHP